MKQGSIAVALSCFLLCASSPGSVNCRNVLQAPIFSEALASAKIHLQAAGVFDQSEAWWHLRQGQLLVNQNSVLDVKGLCAATCMINSLQIAAVLSDRAPLSNPQRALQNLVLRHQLDDLQINLGNITGQLQELFDTRFGTGRMNVSKIDIYDDNTGRGPYQPLTKEDLEPLPGEVKILISLQLNQANQKVESHAQIVESMHSSILNLVEPNQPEIEVQAKYSGTTLVNKVPCLQFRYSNLFLKGIESFVVVGVVTIRTTVPKFQPRSNSTRIRNFWNQLTDFLP